MSIAVLLALAAGCPQAESKVRDSIAALEKALVEKDETVGDLIELPRLLKEMERRGAIPDSNLHFRSARRLEQNLSTIVNTPGAILGGWKKFEPLSVKINPAGDEAEALCRVTLGEKKAKFRVWLSRSGDHWRTYDLENLDGTYRLSVIGLQYTPGVHDDDDRQSLRDGVMALQRAALTLSRGQAEGAREALAMARRSSPPEYVLDWIDLVDGQSLSELGDPLGGLKAADRVLLRQKDLAVAHRLKAVCHAALKDHVKAIAAAKEYLKLVGDDAEIWTLIGGSYHRLGKMEDSVEAYGKAIAADAEDHDSRWELGCLLLERRKTKEAAALFSAAAKLAPEEEEIFESASDRLDRAGAHAEALALAEEAAARRPDDASVLSRLGRGFRTVGRLKEAEETLRSALKTYPRISELEEELVLVLAQTGNDAEAQERMKAVAAADDWRSAYIRAFVHAAAGRNGPAGEALKAVFDWDNKLGTTLAWIEKEPVFGKLRTDALLGPARATREYWAAREDHTLSDEQMLGVTEARIKALPEFALAHYDRGRMLRRLKRLPEAEASLRKAVELSKDKTLFQEELGRTLAAQGKLDEALAVAEELIRAKPRATEFGMDLKVAVYAIAGKKELALRALSALLEKHPDWFPAAATGEELDEFRRLPSVQEILRKARAKTRK